MSERRDPPEPIKPATPTYLEDPHADAHFRSIRWIGRVLVVMVIGVSLWTYFTTRDYRAQACSRAEAFHAFLLSDAGLREQDARQAADAAAIWGTLAATGPVWIRPAAGEIARLRTEATGSANRVAGYWRSLDVAGLRGC